MQIKLRVFRFNPERDQKPHYDTFVMEVDPNDRVLDLLEYVKADFDSTLALRRSCALTRISL